MARPYISHMFVYNEKPVFIPVHFSVNSLVHKKFNQIIRINLYKHFWDKINENILRDTNADRHIFTNYANRHRANSSKILILDWRTLSRAVQRSTPGQGSTDPNRLVQDLAVRSGPGTKKKNLKISARAGSGWTNKNFRSVPVRGSLP